MALLDAGLPMRACVAATTVAYLSDGSIILDPLSSEEKVRFHVK